MQRQTQKQIRYKVLLIILFLFPANESFSEIIPHAMTVNPNPGTAKNPIIIDINTKRHWNNENMQYKHGWACCNLYEKLSGS